MVKAALYTPANRRLQYIAVLQRVKMKLLLFFINILLFLSLSENSILEATCGIQTVPKHHHRVRRIIGGIDAEPGSWPWVVNIQMPTKNGYGYVTVCGGTILDNLWVLTAAHCLYKLQSYTNLARIVLGANRASQLGPDTQIRAIEEFIRHEHFEYETKKNDIALIRLNKPIEFNDYIQPGCLPPQSSNVSEMDDCHIVGWGVLQEEHYTLPSKTLKEARVEIINAKLCNDSNWYNGTIYDYNICAGYEQGGSDICQGDSGGPLMCKKERAALYYVFGVVSWGGICGKWHQNGVYTSVQHFEQWILNKINSSQGTTDDNKEKTSEETTKSYNEDTESKLAKINDILSDENTEYKTNRRKSVLKIRAARGKFNNMETSSRKITTGTMQQENTHSGWLASHAPSQLVFQVKAYILLIACLILMFLCL
ncbi:acrosin-like [Xenopus laevis]|uniref:Acrosin-like n=2 Tax=Xenopus laevis TaxID=8355 RepID=A0A8J1L6L0_XENLA|nr:acrosin-like [Xenopus laevis]